MGMVSGRLRAAAAVPCNQNRRLCGAFLISVLLVSLILTLDTAGPKNIFAVLFGFDALVYHYQAIKFSTADRIMP
jgi:hypothetical protein